jgi:hypothetical protein
MDPTVCEREVEGLHAFFESWFTGRGGGMDRARRALGPAFEMVTPAGELRPREAVLSGIEGAKGSHDPAFAIEIRNVDVVDRTGDRCLLRYEEHQSGGGGDTARVSTALFGPDDDAPEGVQWIHLQETWLPGSGPES